jgi:hypothetical protein
MDKRKTSIVVDENTWKEWTFFVIGKTGSSRKLSIELENALKEYMAKHGEIPKESV